MCATACDPAKLEHLEHPSLIDVHAHARDTSDMERCSGCSNPAPVDRFALTVAALLGQAWPQPIELPGRVHRIATAADDEPLDRAELLASSESAATVALLLGLSATRVHALRQRAPTHHTLRTGAGPGAQGINAAGTKDQNGNH